MMITVNIDRFKRLSVNGDDHTKYEFGTQASELMKSDKDFSPAETELIGQEIFDNIFHGENRLQILKNALSSGEEVAIKIASEDKEAQDIPFELIYNKKDGGYLAKHLIGLVRDIPNSVKLKPQTKLDVINMLVIISLAA